MPSIVEHRLAFVAWEWAEHRHPGNLALHVVGNAIALTCLSLLFAKLPLPFGLSLAWPYLAALLLYQARTDLLSASIAALILALTTGAWRGEFYLEHDHSLLGVLALLAGYVAAGLPVLWGHTIFHDRDVDRMHGPPGGKLGRTLEAIFTGWPVYILISLLRSGYRPALRARVEAQALTYYRE